MESLPASGCFRLVTILSQSRRRTSTRHKDGVCWRACRANRQEGVMAADDRGSALRAAIEQFGEAWARGDSATLDAMLSPTYTHVDVFGAFHDRANWLSYAAGRAGRSTRIALRDVRTRFLGDVAIVTGLNHVEGTGGRSAEDQASVTL